MILRSSYLLGTNIHLGGSGLSISSLGYTNVSKFIDFNQEFTFVVDDFTSWSGSRSPISSSDSTC